MVCLRSMADLFLLWALTLFGDGLRCNCGPGKADLARVFNNMVKHNPSHSAMWGSLAAWESRMNAKASEAVETEATAEPTNVNVSLPQSIAVNIKYHGEQQINLNGKTPEWFLWAIRNGIRQSVADADAGKAGTKDGEDAVKAKFDRIAEGQIPAQGAGGGKKADVETVAARTVVANVLHNSFGYGKTDAKKVAKDDPWLVLFSHYVKEEAKESGESLDDDQIKEFAGFLGLLLDIMCE